MSETVGIERAKKTAVDADGAPWRDSDLRRFLMRIWAGIMACSFSSACWAFLQYYDGLKPGARALSGEAAAITAAVFVVSFVVFIWSIRLGFQADRMKSEAEANERMADRIIANEK